MGTSLSYETTGPLNADIRKSVIDFLEAESHQREWWAESMILFDSSEYPDHVFGDTKLFCLIDDDAADCFMAREDAEFIIERLENASSKWGIGWTLTLAGENAGQIQNGTRDDVVQQMLDSFDLIADVEYGTADFSQYEREKLLKQHPDRC